MHLKEVPSARRRREDPPPHVRSALVCTSLYISPSASRLAKLCGKAFRRRDARLHAVLTQKTGHRATLWCMYFAVNFTRGEKWRGKRIAGRRDAMRYLPFAYTFFLRRDKRKRHPASRQESLACLETPPKRMEHLPYTIAQPYRETQSTVCHFAIRTSICCLV